MATPDSTVAPPSGGGENDVVETIATIAAEKCAAYAKQRHDTPLAAQPKVGSVVLFGQSIVSLTVDDRERLCLAQISNTLLKPFTYNEIHNRRVALGITCVQCTPVQLELLRRAGAMPASSRRCGMITRREAERLCNSFLGDTSPPALPEHFTFDVLHRCAWGCRGLFFPSRYNSSRAKCIKCCHCGGFFSPNKFIFHSHHTPDATYVQPDAANFNSWRRHILLTADAGDDVLHAWEDVKAMFNGGSRKRSFPSDSDSICAGAGSAAEGQRLAARLSSKHSRLSSGSANDRVSKGSDGATPLDLGIRAATTVSADRAVPGPALSGKLTGPVSSRRSSSAAAFTASGALHPPRPSPIVGEPVMSSPENVWFPPVTAACWPELSSLAALTSGCQHLWPLSSRVSGAHLLSNHIPETGQHQPPPLPALPLLPASAGSLLGNTGLLDYPALYSLDAAATAAAAAAVSHPLFRPSLADAVASVRAHSSFQSVRPPWLAALDKQIMLDSIGATDRKTQVAGCLQEDKLPAALTHGSAMIGANIASVRSHLTHPQSHAHTSSSCTSDVAHLSFHTRGSP